MVIKMRDARFGIYCPNKASTRADSHQNVVDNVTNTLRPGSVQ